MKKILIAMIAMCAAFVSVHAQDSQWHSNADCDSLYHYTCDCGCHNHPVNNYSGLNSLRKRLANRSWDGSSERSSAWGLSLDGSSSDVAPYGNNGSGPDGGDDYASSAGNGFGRTSYDDRGLSPDDAGSKALEYLSKAGKGLAHVCQIV